MTKAATPQSSKPIPSELTASALPISTRSASRSGASSPRASKLGTSRSGAVRYHVHPSPIGPLLLVWRDEALVGLYFPEGPKARGPDPDWHADPGPFAEACQQLDGYFAKDLQRFDLPLAPQGSPFQLKVWGELALIPFGQTRSYGEIAHRLQKPGAARAVGLANGANPLGILLPCHRVIGARGALTGFGGGMAAKDYLLRHEGHGAPAAQLSLF